jgi:hypothetical protein
MLLTEKCRLWLEQFALSDRPDAERLLSEFKFVDADTFRHNLSTLITGRLPRDEPAAFYVEREVPSTTKTMYPEKKQSRGKGKKPKRRAEGLARDVIRPRYVNQVVGSEGVIASLVGQLQRADPSRRWVAPSMDILREQHVRHLVLVTDLIGSGSRISRYLSLLWNTRSIKSWSSYHKVSIWVFAYGATKYGLNLAIQHRSSPTVEVVSECPTLRSITSGAALKALCKQYSPAKKDPLGYKQVGALIAFAHGCPNDVPTIFRLDSKSVKRPWKALFPGRTTLSIAIDDEPDSLELALDTLGFGAIKHSGAYTRSSVQQKKMIVLLCAQSRGRRHWNSMTLATGLRLEEIEQLRISAMAQGYLRGNGRLTESGFALLRKLRKPTLITSKSYTPGTKQRYYPTSLRAPR